jgi:hypothetical protein
MAKENNIRNPNGRFDQVSGTLFVMAFAILILPLVAGCGNDCNECPDPAVTYAPPFPPDGVFSITGDGIVTVCWNDKPENFNTNPNDDVVTYGIYMHTSPTGTYEHEIDVDAAVVCDEYGLCCTDIPVANGQTRYFAVTSLNRAGFESEDLSYEFVEDTPRPEGWLVLKDLGQNAAVSGLDFDPLTVRPWNHNTTDIYFGQLDGVFYFHAAAGVDIQDFGYVLWEAVDWAPDGDDGWSSIDQVEIILGHMYVIRVQSGPTSWNYAKIEVTDVNDDPQDLNDEVGFNWAYQEITNLPELAPGGGAMQ